MLYCKGLGIPVLDSCRFSFGLGGVGAFFAGTTNFGFEAGISGMADSLPFASVVGLTGVRLGR